MSLYEPSVRSSTWSVLSRRLSRRFTTLEGWREVGVGVYAMSSNIRMFSLKHQFDPEHFREEFIPMSTPDVPPVPNVPDVPDVPNLPNLPNLPNTLPEEEWVRTSQGTVGKAIGSVSEITSLRKGRIVGKEQPYHVYERKEKWTLVAIVGVAGLFPGLTTNIYLPTLNAVANVRNS